MQENIVHLYLEKSIFLRIVNYWEKYFFTLDNYEEKII